MRKPDLLVIGCGLAGAAVAHAAAGRGMHVLILEAGTSRTGTCEHLSRDRRLGFATEVRDRLTRGMLLPIAVTVSDRSSAVAEFLVGTCAGGAGVLWSGICERLDTPTQDGAIFSNKCLAPGYDRAEALLQTDLSADLIRLPSDGFENIRMIRTSRIGDRGFSRIAGPSDLLRFGGSVIDVVHDRLVLTIEHHGGRVRGVKTLNMLTGESESYGAELVVVAADAIRSPALLNSSGLGPETGFPVGYGLTDHPLAVARVIPATDLGKAIAAALASSNATNGCRGLRLAPGAAGATRLILLLPGQPQQLMLFWYAVGHPSDQNQLHFSKSNAGGFGLYDAHARLSVQMASQDELDILVEDLRDVAGSLGVAPRGWAPRLLPIGSARHTFGTLRTAISSVDNGVTDEYGKVRGMANLYVAGPSRLPAACSTNPVLAATAAAICTVDSFSPSGLARVVPSPKSGAQTGQTG